MNILRNKQSIEKSLLSLANQRGTEKPFARPRLPETSSQRIGETIWTTLEK